MKRIPAILQRDITDCGAACLAAILQYYGSHVSVSRIRQTAGTDHKGTNIFGMISAAERNGLQAKGARANVDSLPMIPTPAIMHVNMPNGLQHFVILAKVGKRKVRIMDPGVGRFRQLKISEFAEMWSGVFIMLSPLADFSVNKVGITTLTRFISLAKPLKIEFLLGFMGAIVFTILGFSTAIYIQKLMDDVIEQGNYHLLHILGGCMLLILLLQTLIGIIRNMIGFKTGQIIDARLISGYYRHLFNLPQRFFDTMRIGEIVSRLNDAVKIRLFINDVAMGIVLNTLIVIMSMILLSFYFWKLALLVLAILPVYILLHVITTRINRKWQRKLMEQSADLESKLVENLQAVSTIKRLGLEGYVIDRIEASFFRLMNICYRAGIYNLFAGTSADFVNRLLVIVVLWLGGLLVIQRELTPGELLSFYTLIGYFTSPVLALISSGKGLQDAMIAASRLFEITDLETEEELQMPAIDPNRVLFTEIKFNAVSFRYGLRALVLQDISLCFRKSEITAVVGESGSGKSTILNLIQSLYPVHQGQITIGDIPLQHFNLQKLRALIGVVPQHVEIFSGTIAENVFIGDNTPDLERVIRICQTIGADEFIRLLPDGYYSLLGEKGTSLSGGQQQKLAIARALYRDPEILIMDEATAHLDPLSEYKIRQMLMQLKASGKTIILIAHRLSTVQIADNIHMLKQGKLVGSGKHAELMESNAHYAALWNPEPEIAFVDLPDQG